MSLPFYPLRPMKGGNRPALQLTRTHGFEPKYNGWRVIINTITGEVFNRQGNLSTIADEIKDAVEYLRLHYGNYHFIDAEALVRRHGLMQGTLMILDFPNGKKLLPGPALSDGYPDRIPEWIPELPIEGEPPESLVYRPPIFRSPTDVAHYWDYMQLANVEYECDFYEGFVAKSIGSRYTRQSTSPDKETEDWIKFRFRTNNY